MAHVQDVVAIPHDGARGGSSSKVAQVEHRVGEPPILEVVNAVHAYGNIIALDHVTFSAAPGEFLTILGESGSGKTTLLRLISGLEKPYKIDALRLSGVDVSDVPAFDRNCTTVFQSYALFPHMTVGANVEYGLKVRAVPAAERQTRAKEALQLVRLADKYDRKIHQLSGGERQRVALARALAPRPALLLLDEPLGALDERLRMDMQVELMEIHKRLGMTFVYITHSQEEALTMSDRILLMRQGKIEQTGPPAEIFDRPISRFVADFMGVENLLDGELVSMDGEQALVRIGGANLLAQWSGKNRPSARDKVVLAVRAERLHIGNQVPRDTGLNVLPGRLHGAIYKGKYLDRTVITEVGQLKARLWVSSLSMEGEGFIWWKQTDCVAMSA